MIVHATGSNTYGQLGIGSTTNQNEWVPVNIPLKENETIDQLTQGSGHVICLTCTIYRYLTHL